MQFFGQRDVLHSKGIERQPVAFEHRQQRLLHLDAQFGLVAGHVDERHTGFAEQIAHAGDHQIAQLPVEIVDRVGLARAGHFLVELRRIGELVRIDAEGAHAHHAEILVADGDRVRRAPLAVELQTGREEVDVGLEGRIEQLVPVLQVGQDRQRLRIQRIKPRSKDVGDLPFIDEDADLRIAHRQLRAVLDFKVLHRVAIRQHPVAFLGPVDDVDKLFLDEVH